VAKYGSDAATCDKTNYETLAKSLMGDDFALYLPQKQADGANT
jgi:hypothetical protein